MTNECERKHHPFKIYTHEMNWKIKINKKNRSQRIDDEMMQL